MIEWEELPIGKIIRGYSVDNSKMYMKVVIELPFDIIPDGWVDEQWNKSGLLKTEVFILKKRKLNYNLKDYGKLFIRLGKWFFLQGKLLKI